MQQETLHRGQFTFYASYCEAVEALPKSRRYEALLAIIRFGLDGEEPAALTGAARSVFEAVRPNLVNGRVKAAARLARQSACSAPESVLPVPPAGRM